MDEIRFIREQYLAVRDDLISWLPKHLAGEAWYYRPTPVSTGAGWIVPHLVAFEHVTIFAKLKGWSFPTVVSPQFVDRYRGGAQGHLMADGELAGPEEAVAVLRRAREATLSLFDALVAGGAGVSAVDRKEVFDRYLGNFAHDTEHFGQLKYLAGTHARLGAR